MAWDKEHERRQSGMTSAAGRRCPWCNGRLELRNRFPLRDMIPGEARARAEEGIPEALRTIRAWVCATPHCKYRESA